MLATFTRELLDERAFAWLGMFANQAAVAIANARANEEVDRLRKQLEMENAHLREGEGRAGVRGDRWTELPHL